MPNRARAWVLAAAFVAAGCGVGGGTVEDAVKEDQSIDGPVNCVDAGWMLFVGERETLYECYQGGANEFDGEAIGCFVYVDGKLSDVSSNLSDEFTCYSDSDSATSTDSGGARKTTGKPYGAEAAYREAYESCDARQSAYSDPEDYFRSIRPMYGAESTEASDLADALAASYARVSPKQAKKPGVKESWRRGCFDAVEASRSP